jgi:hypothetical protein
MVEHVLIHFEKDNYTHTVFKSIFSYEKTNGGVYDLLSYK